VGGGYRHRGGATSKGDDEGGRRGGSKDQPVCSDHPDGSGRQILRSPNELLELAKRVLQKEKM